MAVLPSKTTQVSKLLMASKPESPSPKVVLHPKDGAVKHLLFSPDSQQLLTSCKSGAVELWNIHDKSPIWKIWSQDLSGSPLAVTGDRVLVGGDMYGLDGKAVATTDWSGPMWNMALSPDHLRLATTDEYNTTRFTLVGISSGSRLGPIEADLGPSPALLAIESSEKLGFLANSFWAVCFSPDGTKFATGGRSGIRVWDSRTGDLLLGPWREPGHEVVSSIAWIQTTRGEVIISGSFEGSTIQLWNATNGATLHRPLKEYSSRVQRIAVHPSGKLFATIHVDGCMLLWDVATRRPIGAPVEVLRPPVSDKCIAFSPDGKLVACSRDAFGCINVFDLQGLLPADVYASVV